MSIMFSGRRSPFTPFAPSRLSDTCVAYPGRIGVISDAYIALGLTMITAKPTLQQLAMRLRAATEQTPLRCKEVLEPLSDELRIAYVEHYEAMPGSVLLIDPIELQPEFAEVIASVAREAKQRLSSGELGPGLRGRSGRMWGWMKRTLKERHQIEWRTPSEMTPNVVLD